MACGQFQGMPGEWVQGNHVTEVSSQPVAVLHRGPAQGEMVAVLAHVAPGPVRLHTEFGVRAPADASAITIGLKGHQPDVQGYGGRLRIVGLTGLYGHFLEMAAFA